MGDWHPPIVDRAQQAGFDDRRLERAYDVIRRFVDEGRIPGGVAVVGSRRGVLSPFAHGAASWEPDRRAVTPDTIYDCASVTKVVVTTTLALQLIDEGRLRLDDAAVEFVPEFLGPREEEREAKRRVRIRHLMTHSSGLTAWKGLYESGRTRTEALEALHETPLAYETGTQVVYSCLGFILLGEAIERITDSTLDALARERIFEPLGMHDSGYCPPPDQIERIAPTEKVEGEVLRGVVHDENARSLGGVSGNAGLFSTAADLARFAYFWLNFQEGGGPDILSSAVMRASIADYTGRFGEPRGLGWQLKSSEFSPAGDLFGGRTFGHTGFTGTSLYIDPDAGIFVVLLTNRVHPTRENQAHLRLRPLLHNAAAAALVAPT